MLLYARWRAADAARAAADTALQAALTELARAESGALQATRARQTAEDKLDPLREESAVAGAVRNGLRSNVKASTPRRSAPRRRFAACARASPSLTRTWPARMR